jgi:hypothetical protein
LIAAEPSPRRVHHDEDYSIPVAKTAPSWPEQVNKTSSTLSLEHVKKIVSKYQGAQVTEKGGGLTRRIWVTNPKGWIALESELKKMGFRWAASREGWYKTED